MGTKAEWRNDKLRFYGNPMFTSVATQSTNVRISGAGAGSTTLTLVVSCPIYAGTLSTEQNMHFHAHIGGIVATSTSHIVAILRYGTTNILTVLSSTLKAQHEVYDVPYTVDFHGRFVECSTLGRISAVGVCMMGATTATMACWGTTGSTGTVQQFATSEINLRVDSSLGLNVVMSLDSTNDGAGGAVVAGFTNTVGYIELFSG